jgi:hypothetical protein
LISRWPSPHYAQVNDTKTQRDFYRIQIRAWQRIGQILSDVDLSGCKTLFQKTRKIREAFPKHPVLKQMSKPRIGHLLKLAAMLQSDFDHAIDQNITGSLQDFFKRTPAEEKLRAAYNLEMADVEEMVEAEAREDERKADERLEALEEFEGEIRDAAETAMKSWVDASGNIVRR